MNNGPILTRRRFLKEAAQLTAGIVIANPLESIALTAAAKHPMSFYHTHTGERLHIDYSCDGCSPSTLKKLNTFLRDFRTEEIHPIDPGLLDFLYQIRQAGGCRGEIEIISGYRSPQTNKLLRSNSKGVASKSLHMKGQALDIRLKGLKTRKLRKIAVSLQKGGVGYYPQSDFVHIDTGRVRIW